MIPKSYHGIKHLSRCIGCNKRPVYRRTTGAVQFEGWLIRVRNGVALTCQGCLERLSPSSQARIKAGEVLDRPQQAA